MTHARRALLLSPAVACLILGFASEARACTEPPPMNELDLRVEAGISPGTAKIYVDGYAKFVSTDADCACGLNVANVPSVFSVDAVSLVDSDTLVAASEFGFLPDNDVKNNFGVTLDAGFLATGVTTDSSAEASFSFCFEVTLQPGKTVNDLTGELRTCTVGPLVVSDEWNTATNMPFLGSHYGLLSCPADTVFIPTVPALSDRLAMLLVLVLFAGGSFYIVRRRALPQQG